MLLQFCLAYLSHTSVVAVFKLLLSQRQWVHGGLLRLTRATLYCGKCTSRARMPTCSGWRRMPCAYLWRPCMSCFPQATCPYLLHAGLSCVSSHGIYVPTSLPSSIVWWHTRAAAAAAAAAAVLDALKHRCARLRKRACWRAMALLRPTNQPTNRVHWVWKRIYRIEFEKLQI